MCKILRGGVGSRSARLEYIAESYRKEFYGMRLFGTDGVRGVANTELTAEMAFNLGKAGAYVLGKGGGKPLIIIGRDTRISGDMLEDAISAGILSMGGDVVKAGVLPTPAVAWLVRHEGADAGVVISASHNTFEYNGIKFFNRLGFKLDDAIEDEIEALALGGDGINAHIKGDRLGRLREDSGKAARAYADFLKSTLDVDVSGMKVALDCANGAAYKVAPMVFSELGARVTLIGDSPDGTNINDGCGSTRPEKLQAAVREQGADLGLAFDGDADRLIAVDEKGGIIDGDQLMYIAAKLYKSRKALKNNVITATVMSNIGLRKALAGIGCELQTTDVGDRYVLERMLKTGGVIGGEQSGHVILLDRSTSGDGILTGLQLAAAVTGLSRKPSELAGEVAIYPQVLRNVKVGNDKKLAYLHDETIRAEIKRIEADMAGDGRVLIRPSGTEPLIRVMIEGDDLGRISGMAEGLADLMLRRLG